MIELKGEGELKKMRRAGKIVARVLDELGRQIKPGVTTAELNELAEGLIRQCGGEPTFLGYQGYPAAICTSVNEQVVHGIPGLIELKEGDIVSVDVGATIDGFVGDSARTFAVGKISVEARRLMQVTEESLYKGIKEARAGKHLQDIGWAIQNHVEKCGFSVVRDLVGHGVGRKLHEPPQVPNYGRAGKGLMLEKGMTLAIEPMVNAGVWQVETLKDGWTVVTKDRKLSAHFEHSLVITGGEAEILTKTAD